MENNNPAVLSENQRLEHSARAVRNVYISKYESCFKWCYRRNIGTYPVKWLSPIKKVLRFAVKTCFRHKIEFTARGRGNRAAIAKANNFHPREFDQDLPIKFSKRAALYVSIYRRR